MATDIRKQLADDIVREVAQGNMEKVITLIQILQTSTRDGHWLRAAWNDAVFIRRQNANFVLGTTEFPLDGLTKPARESK